MRLLKCSFNSALSSSSSIMKRYFLCTTFGVEGAYYNKPVKFRKHVLMLMLFWSEQIAHFCNQTHENTFFCKWLHFHEIYVITPHIISRTMLCLIIHEVFER